MIPEDLVKFLDGASVGFGATRDDQLVPFVHFILGWTVSEDRQTITCLFGPPYGERVIPYLENNGRFSLTVLGSTSGPRSNGSSNPGVDSHECYQFKGNYVASSPANNGHHALVMRKREQFKALFQPLFGFSDRACNARYPSPVLAMTFRVEEIYDQTPGPGAGARMLGEKSGGEKQ